MEMCTGWAASKPQQSGPIVAAREKRLIDTTSEERGREDMGTAKATMMMVAAESVLTRVSGTFSWQRVLSPD
jgi:hypothetical protein